MTKLNIKVKSVDLNREPTAREKVFFVVVLAATLFIFLDVLWKPESVRIHTLKKEMQNIQAQVDAVKKLIDATRQQINQPAGEQDKEAVLNDYVKQVLDRKIIDLAEEVNTTADLMRSPKFAKRADVLNVEVGNRSEVAGFVTVPIVIHLKGRYTAIRDYFEALENIGRPLIVDSFTMEKEGEKSNNLNVNIEAQLFVPKI